MALANNGAALIGSEDGLKWVVLPNAPITPTNASITYNTLQKAFVIGRNNGNICYSTDGYNWNSSTLPDTSHGGYLFQCDIYTYAASYNSSNIMYRSSDLQNWSTVNMPSNTQWRSISYNPSRNRWIGVGGYTSGVYSTNGTTFTEATLPSTTHWYETVVNTAENVTYAVGGGYSSQTVTSAYALNGNVWYGKETTANLHRVTYSNTFGVVAVNDYAREGLWDVVNNRQLMETGPNCGTTTQYFDLEVLGDRLYICGYDWSGETRIPLLAYTTDTNYEWTYLSLPSSIWRVDKIVKIPDAINVAPEIGGW